MGGDALPFGSTKDTFEERVSGCSRTDGTRRGAIGSYRESRSMYQKEKTYTENTALRRYLAELLPVRHLHDTVSRIVPDAPGCASCASLDEWLYLSTSIRIGKSAIQLPPRLGAGVAGASHGERPAPQTATTQLGLPKIPAQAREHVRIPASCMRHDHASAVTRFLRVPSRYSSSDVPVGVVRVCGRPSCGRGVVTRVFVVMSARTVRRICVLLHQRFESAVRRAHDHMSFAGRFRNQTESHRDPLRRVCHNHKTKNPKGNAQIRCVHGWKNTTNAVQPRREKEGHTSGSIWQHPHRFCASLHMRSNVSAGSPGVGRGLAGLGVCRATNHKCLVRTLVRSSSLQRQQLPRSRYSRLHTCGNGSSILVSTSAGNQSALRQPPGNISEYRFNFWNSAARPTGQVGIDEFLPGERRTKGWWSHRSKRVVRWRPGLHCLPTKFGWNRAAGGVTQSGSTKRQQTWGKPPSDSRAKLQSAALATLSRCGCSPSGSHGDTSSSGHHFHSHQRRDCDSAPSASSHCRPGSSHVSENRNKTLVQQ